MRQITLRDENIIPAIGLGTWQMTGDVCTDAVRSALEIGYRHIDTADNYRNHTDVARGIRESGVAREDLFLTTKIWRDYLQQGEVVSQVQRFLEELEVEYLDLLLIHWPNIDVPIAETLSVMQELKTKGIIRSLGVSNFTIPLLQEALATKIPFVTNQIEFHPSLNQKELKEFCDQEEIVVTAYSPIAQGADLKIPLIIELAGKYDKTPSQIIINWLLEKGCIVIPRSSKKERLKENFTAQDFSLEKIDIQKIDEISLHNRIVRPAFAPFTD